MGCVDDVGAVKVGNGSSDFDDFEVGAGGEVELFGGGVEERFGGGRELDEGGDLVRGEGRVEDVGAAIASALAS